ncbi:MAG TPA: hypothetical protein VEB22_13195 [Phycisphaerales bacterium]|nr:hypothetical protein [Phycisphaerales bacterium]
MSSVNAFFSSPTASTSLMKAFMAQSRAATLQSLSFFSGSDPMDTVDFSQTAFDSSFLMSIVQSGNTGLFSGIYKDAAAFNQSLLSSVSAAAGLSAGFSNSLIGQLVDQAA